MTGQQGNSASKQAGILPIRPAQGQAQTPSPADGSKSARSKTAAQDGVKIKIRRLPPGITEQEFEVILGDAWKAGNGKVGWFEFHAGHIPKSASKEPTPAFALLQVKEKDVDDLSQVVQNAIWEDAKGTFNSPSLVGPPSMERSVYKKIPLGKPKKDPKEGTIDQDEDYMAFLASLAEDPTMKQNAGELNAEDMTEPASDTKATTTPLVQAILDNREKRANKAKEVASSKSSKHARQESQGTKGKASASSPEDSKKKSKEKGTERPKETVRILRKQTATEAAAEAAKAVAKDIKAGASASDVANSRRAGIQGVANILKRDLGLSSGSAARKARQEMAKQESSKKTEPDTKGKDTRGKDKENNPSSAGTSSTQAPERPSTPTAPKAQAEKSSRSGRSRRGKEPKAAEPKAGGNSETPAATPKAPVILQKKKDDTAITSSTKDQTPAPATKPASKPTASTAAPTPPTGPRAATAKGSQAQKKSSTPVPASGATRAFLKHANPSQGVTEALLKESMLGFGGVTFVEIDRRKGFAYVDFADHEGLAKAMAASPVSVAQATVQVLERKEQSKKTAPTPSNPTPTAAASSTSAAAGPSNPPTAPSSNADKSGNATSGEQQQPKRSRRRGRGRGGNGGAAGNAEGKSADQGASGGAGASTPAAASSSNG